MKNWFPLMLRKAYSWQYKFSYEWQRLEMTNTLRKIHYFLSVKIHSVKATLLHEVMKILGSFCLVALPSQILMVPDVHLHCISLEMAGRKRTDASAFAGKIQKLAPVGSYLLRLRATPSYVQTLRICFNFICFHRHL